MELVIVGINYNASKYLEDFLDKWGAVKDVSKIIIVDNFYNDIERNVVIRKCKHYGAVILCLDNKGYGASLNYALKYLIDQLPTNNFLILFGNTDVYPVSIDIKGVDDTKVPEIVVLEKGRNRNPFINQWAYKLLFILKYSAYYESKTLRNLWIVMQKFIALIPGKTVAVHGAMFALTLNQLKLLHPIFNEKVFLYCEELFFARKVVCNGFGFRKVGLEVNHIGSVSTSKTIKKDRKKFFSNWLKSIKIYFNGD